MKEDEITVHFNRPYLTGFEMEYIRLATKSGKLSGNGEFTHRCQHFFEQRYGFKKCLLTTSGTDALEMAAILTGVGPGDEVIVPSYTFVSTALAFVRCGAKVVFADSRPDEPNIDATKIETLITPHTKVIVPVHYAGVACDMDVIMDIAYRHNLLVVEDAAQAIDSFYTGRDGTCRALGTIGHIGCFSFHETKNIISGEGGMLTINDERFVRRAEIIWEKGPNRAEFFRGEVNKYGWVDVGSLSPWGLPPLYPRQDRRRLVVRRRHQARLPLLRHPRPRRRPLQEGPRRKLLAEYVECVRVFNAETQGRRVF